MGPNLPDPPLDCYVAFAMRTVLIWTYREPVVEATRGTDFQIHMVDNSIEFNMKVDAIIADPDTLEVATIQNGHVEVIHRSAASEKNPTY